MFEESSASQEGYGLNQTCHLYTVAPLSRPCRKEHPGCTGRAHTTRTMAFYRREVYLKSTDFSLPILLFGEYLVFLFVNQRKHTEKCLTDTSPYKRTLRRRAPFVHAMSNVMAYCRQKSNGLINHYRTRRGLQISWEKSSVIPFVFCTPV